MNNIKEVHPLSELETYLYCDEHAGKFLKLMNSNFMVMVLKLDSSYTQKMCFGKGCTKESQVEFTRRISKDDEVLLTGEV